MSSIQIVADSTCDLTPELIRRHGIHVIPLHVGFGERTFRDGVDLTAEELYEKVETLGTLPKTAAPSPAEFAAVFEPIIREGGRIVCITLSSKLSSTYQNAVIAAGEFPDCSIEVVDSCNLSTGIGLTVLKAADYLNGGTTDLSWLAAKLKEDAKLVEAEFVIDTLDYLHKGGRCSGTQLVIGSLLRIHPLIVVEDGRMTVAEKLRGKKDRVSQALLERVLAHKDNLDPERVFVTHSMSEDNAHWLKVRLEQELPFREVLVANAGCVISSHCGPGTVGILFKKKH